MQFITTTILLSLSAAVMSAPAAAPDAAPNAAAEAVPVAFAAPAAAPEPVLTGLFERSGSEKACCPKGKKSQCSPCAPSAQCPADKPDKYSSCTKIGQVGLANLLLCNVLNGNTISVPVTLSVLSS